jgi:hypothetical protein
MIQKYDWLISYELSLCLWRLIILLSFLFSIADFWDEPNKLMDQKVRYQWIKEAKGLWNKNDRPLLRRYTVVDGKRREEKRVKEGWPCTRESRIWGQPRVKELPTFPLLGFYCWEVTDRHGISLTRYPLVFPKVIFIKVLSVLCPNLTDASLNLWSITVSTLGPQQRSVSYNRFNR